MGSDSDQKKRRTETSSSRVPADMRQGRLVSVPENGQCLDTVELARLEAAFRRWAESAVRKDVRLSRQRVLLVFLMVRYTGAKLSEVLALDPFADVDPEGRTIFLGRAGADAKAAPRRVRISTTLAREIGGALADRQFRDFISGGFGVDPGFVRRKFYERARECGFSSRLGGPEMIRRARAVELMQGSLPLPVVQMMMGHSTPELTSSYVSFSKEEIQQVAGAFMEREAGRKTSARNTFFGKIDVIDRGDIQARVELLTLGGHRIATVVTNGSLELLGLHPGGLISAEIKAPWVMLQAGGTGSSCSAENRLAGTVERITAGTVNTEVNVRLSDGTEMCALVSTQSSRRMDLQTGNLVWVLFNAYAVVLHAD
ncbi:MAG: TOBE domain-containing protein [Thermodesulfobacteriota bacterium]|nr:TOBE domain-containing protein [Thermodesulfobacteriota bacterium]